MCIHFYVAVPKRYFVLQPIFSVQKKRPSLREKSVNNLSCWIWAKAGCLELLVKIKIWPSGSFMLQMLHLRWQHWNTEKHVGFIEILSISRLPGPYKSKCHFWNTSFTSPSVKQTTFRKVLYGTDEVELDCHHDRETMELQILPTFLWRSQEKQRGWNWISNRKSLWNS